MRRLGPVAALIAVLVLFFVANRGAYQSTFSDDDLDNIAWTRTTPASTFLSGLLSPRYFPNHFRPVGHFTYYVLANTAGLQFRPYVGTIHLLHFANAVLLWLLLRRLGLDGWRAGVGTVFFIFNMALFDALWKPMYLFDLWCALFCLAALIFYIDGRLLLSLAAFWFAYKSKEHAVALPAVLLAYEWLVGQKQWKRVLPFAAIAASFVLQGVLVNQKAGEDYRLQFSLEALDKTIRFYAGDPIVVLLIFFFCLVEGQRILLGAVAAICFLAPMLVLPGRVSGAYLYVAMIGVAIAAAAYLARHAWWCTALLLAVWLPLNYDKMRDHRRAALAGAHENQAYLTAAASLPVRAPGVHRFIYDGFPPGLKWWGILGALRFYYNRQDLEMFSIEDKNLTQLFEQGDVALLKWDNPRRQLTVVKRSPGEPDQAFIRMDETTPIWQLEEGWYQGEHKYRWIKPRASARLFKPAGATEFTAEVNIGPKYLADVKRARLNVAADGKAIGSAEFASGGWQTVKFPVASGPAATIHVEFTVEPEYRPSATDPRVLGIPIGAFGFAGAKP